MRKGLGIVLCAVLALAGDDGLGGRIETGKAKRLAEAGAALMKKADAIFRRWVLEQIPETELLAELERGIGLYDEGAAKLQQALDIQEDGAVLHRLHVGAKRLQKMRFMVHFRLRPQVKPRATPPKRESKPEPAPEPDPRPSPAPDAGPEPTLDDEDAPAPRVDFAAGEPPARPGLVESPSLPMDEDERAAALKRDRKSIETLLKDYLGARKVRKLTYRHKVCRGKGAFRDGTPCEECRGTGERINLHRFRKAYWNAFTPLLRAAPGALDALRAYYRHAGGELDALGPRVKAFRIEDIEHHGFWAKVTVSLKTTAGEEAVVWTVVGIGSNWYFYTPATDAELVPTEE